MAIDLEMVLAALTILIRLAWTGANGFGLRIAISSWMDAHRDLEACLSRRSNELVILTARLDARTQARLVFILGCQTVVGLIALAFTPPLTAAVPAVVPILSGGLFILSAWALIVLSFDQRDWRQETKTRLATEKLTEEQEGPH